jgi:hypothetical protein
MKKKLIPIAWPCSLFVPFTSFRGTAHGDLRTQETSCMDGLLVGMVFPKYVSSLFRTNRQVFGAVA